MNAGKCIYPVWSPGAYRPHECGRKFRWLMRKDDDIVGERRVCGVHANVLEKRGWTRIGVVNVRGELE